jgi:Tol biopolymer transport system component
MTSFKVGDMILLLVATCGRLLLIGTPFVGYPDFCDATEPVRLTFDGRVKRDPIVWPDGKQVTYSTVTDEGVSRLMRLDLTDGSTRLFHSDESLPDRELTVSASGAEYAYVYVTPDGQRARVIVQRTQPTTKVTLEPGTFGLWPTMSPNGQYVALTINGGAMVSVDLAQIEGSPTVAFEAKTDGPVVRLTDADASYGDLWPKYSPDGKQIVFSSRRDDDFEIYLMNADGSSQQRLTTSPGIDAHPSFSPDGKRVVFTTARDRNYEIYTMKLDGSDLRRITDHSGRDDFACWHPDGKRLIVVSQRAGRHDLYWVDVP